jgi:hypothetical protein
MAMALRADGRRSVVAAATASTVRRQQAVVAAKRSSSQTRSTSGGSVVSGRRASSSSSGGGSGSGSGSGSSSKVTIARQTALAMVAARKKRTNDNIDDIINIGSVTASTDVRSSVAGGMVPLHILERRNVIDATNARSMGLRRNNGAVRRSNDNGNNRSYDPTRYMASTNDNDLIDHHRLVSGVLRGGSAPSNSDNDRKLVNNNNRRGGNSNNHINSAAASEGTGSDNGAIVEMEELVAALEIDLLNR